MGEIIKSIFINNYYFRKYLPIASGLAFIIGLIYLFVNYKIGILLLMVGWLFVVIRGFVLLPNEKKKNITHLIITLFLIFTVVYFIFAK